MFVLTTFLYPVVLAMLCVGAGLLVDRCSRGWLPGLLLPATGAGALIAVSQLTTYAPALAPATPWVMAAVALAGLTLGKPRIRVMAHNRRAWRWQLVAPVLVYVLALAPVLLAGRPTFSSYMALADSAVHMMGADFLLHHGQHYAHLDLRNSYGQFINNYYNTSYPSGSDTLFGGSAFLLGLPLIWAFQPFNAFMLAVAAGPAWLLVRRTGLERGWAALAALSITVPALVYGYELVGSVKEITALAMILTMGALVVLHPRWLRGGPAGAIPFALVAAAGVSALGAGFGAWVLAAAAVLAVLMLIDIAAAPRRAPGFLRLTGAGLLVALISAWPTWVGVSGSLRVAQDIASTGNAGNLPRPLHAAQVFGVWLRGSYKVMPAGGALELTRALIAITLLAALLGAVWVIRRREYPLAGWIALMLLAWLLVSAYSTTWVDAKTLMLTSPLVVLLAWAGVAALRASPLPLAAAFLAVALAAGAIASDAMQYHSSNLAPTARYQELASLNGRFAGRGPTLFTDFDEYSLYELRDLDVGGPDFVYPPRALAGVARGYGDPVDLDRAPARALLSYPLIVTRRDPSAARPPSAYALLWQGTYYQVWGRRPGAGAALAHVALPGAPGAGCAAVRNLAALARAHGAQLVGAASPELVRIRVARAPHPAGWAHQHEGLVMSRPGRLSATFHIPAAGVWDLWLQGQMMPAVSVSVDGHPLATIDGQLDGNSLVPDTITPLRLHLSAGAHRVSVARGGFTLGPGNGGAAVLDAIFLTPAGAAEGHTLLVTAPARWRSLCGQALDWVEVVRA